MELVLFADENPFAAKESSPEKRDGASIEIPDLEDAERSEIIEKIRELDEAILDEEVSAKIRRIQDLTDRILAVVEANPQKKPQIRTFMNYYLPTTLKLLKSYSEFEAQGIAGDTIAQTKASISAILDNLVKGYEQQLDQLFQSEAMDISSDIQVLESMMRRDGLAGEYPFRTEKAADPPKDQTLTLN